MNTARYLEDPYTKAFQGKIADIQGNVIKLESTFFYPTSGGQPGDSGILKLPNGTTLRVVEAQKGKENPYEIFHVLEGANDALHPGMEIEGLIDWDRRYAHMRMHSCLHLLCSLVVGDVTGGQVGADKGRLDFNLPDIVPDKDELTEKLNALIREDHPIATLWITDEELAAKPELIRTMSVKPPMGLGQVRIVRIGTEDHPIDLQPCGGTHVKSTAEIGPVIVSKIENKGQQNRRIVVSFT